MKIVFSLDFLKQLKKIKRKDPQLFRSVEKKMELFQNYPESNSLRIHKLTGKLKNLKSISINRSIRAVYIEEDNRAYFVDIGTHEEVYQIN